jgi:hypothetical protein
MARKTGGAPAGRPTGVTVTRRPGYIYFVDGQGNVRETRRSTGGKPGRKSCWPRDYTYSNIPSKTGAPRRHPLAGETIIKAAPSGKTVHEMEQRTRRSFRAGIAAQERRRTARKTGRKTGKKGKKR